MFEQQVHGPHVVLLTGDVKRSEAVLDVDQKQDQKSTISRTNKFNSASYQSTRVSFGALVQEDFNHPVVTAVGCYMKRGQVVQGDVIDLSVVLQQLPQAVQVVSLGRHVDGGQAVLSR